MSLQTEVEQFLDEYDMHMDPTYRLLDVTAELGEVSAEAVKSAEYGSSPHEMAISDDEYGDLLFAILALGVELDKDATAALNTALQKYGQRLDTKGDAGSGR
ncbi:MAG: MazG-like family protein [Halobacteriaceae archaeon]